MKKKMISLMMVMIMVFLTSCGKEIPIIETIEPVETNDVITVETDTDNLDEITDEVVEDETLTNLDAIEEANESSLNLKEYKYSFEDRKAADEGEPIFYLADFEDDKQHLELEDSVSIYASNGKCVGHTKEGITIYTIGRYEDWYYLVLDRDYRFLKVSEVEAVAVDMSKINEEEPVATETTTPVKDSETASTPVTETIPEAVPEVTETPVEVPAESDKYTPEEAVSIYRSIMEGGGITWNPSLKGVTSWGTGWIYLDKGMPELIGSSNLEAYARGDTVGNPFTQYYLEVTGSDENAVYFTAWHN